jgi:hypothetical protein
MTQLIPTLSEPTNAQFYILCILLFAPTCFGANAFLRELTPVFLKYTTIK